MKLQKTVFCLLMASALLILSIPAVHTSAAKESTERQPTEPTVYHIGICLDTTDEYTAYVVRGFKDVLNNEYGKNQVVFAEQNTSDSASAATAVEALIQSQSQLLFTYGEDSLSAAAGLTNTIPIVFGNVTDYRNLLHLLKESGNTTGRNITGIAGIPSIGEQLSLLIETTDHAPHAVGILYDPSDADSILQNDIMEHYLDEAGIPWREYEISDTDDLPADQTSAVSSDTTEAGDAVAIPFPSITAAASGKEGANIHPDSIGESGDLTGINEPMSARTAQVSPLWGEAAPVDNLPFEEAVRLACAECDALYFCAENEITADSSRMALIRSAAAETDTVTVGGDEIIGDDTLVCLYEDPYDLGYRCGEMCIRILNGDDAIEEMPVARPDPDAATKLYDADIAAAFGKTFPKSFHERNSYLENYVPGALTKTDEE
ncbi:MAG: hypothetical protein IJ682_04875 [Lachnospiraceae bacterium]|nr:hypothetical protein [Lachnospiraceae bacterium]